MLLQLMSNSVK